MPEVLAPPAPAAAAPAAPAAPAAAPSFGSLIQKAADADKAKTAPATAKPPVKMVDETKPDPIKKAATPPAPEKAELPKPPEAKVEPAKPTPPKAEGETKTEPGKFALLHKAEKERDQYKRELEKLRTEKPPEDPDKQVLSERLTKAEKRAQELDEQMRYIDYQKSAEFQDKYYKPYVKEFQRSSAIAQQLVVLNEDGTRRTVTQAEFGKLISAASEEEADEIANNLFPNNPTKATKLIDLRDKLVIANGQMNEALEEFRTKGAERVTQKKLEMEQASKSEKAKYAAEVESVAAEFPEYFKDGEDKTENEQRQKYAKIVDDTLDSDKPNLKNVARLRHAGVNFPIVKARLEKALTRIAELEAKEAARDASVPGAGSPSTEAVGGGAPAEKTMADRIKSAAG